MTDVDSVPEEEVIALCVREVKSVRVHPVAVDNFVAEYQPLRDLYDFYDVEVTGKSFLHNQVIMMRTCTVLDHLY